MKPLAAASRAALVAGGGLVLYQVVRQQGRMMLRIDELERLLGVGGGARDGHIGHVAHGSQAVGTPVGLPVGSALEPFTLPDLDGNDVALESFRGRQVLVVNWSPTCTFCDRIGADLAELEPRLAEAGTAMVLLAHGEVEANRALVERYGLKSPVLMLGEANPAGFQSLGTPSGFLLDADGKVATTLAIGADQVPLLANDVADAGGPGGGEKRLRGMRNLSESRLVRDGLKAGTPAPPFTLPDLDGHPVSLEDFKGRRVLLTFSAPDCGPCDTLAPELVRIHRDHAANNLAVVMVGRGDVDENRQKAEKFGMEFPVVLQEGWKVSRDYGIFATPVAFLIDEHGTITHDVATGVEDILALVPAAGGTE
ncbi:MAG: TlpA disulfide reductase family protein [Actinomycetota bacterium]